MSGISPVSGAVPPAWPRESAAPRGADAPEGKPSFLKAVRGYVDGVDAEQQTSYAAIQDLLSGKTQDALPVVAAVARADLSFKLLVGVRNKVIQAYQQTMNMQV